MRFPRINRLRWDKPPREADRLETLERMLKASDEFQRAPDTARNEAGRAEIPALRRFDGH